MSNISDNVRNSLLLGLCQPNVVMLEVILQLAGGCSLLVGQPHTVAGVGQMGREKDGYFTRSENEMVVFILEGNQIHKIF